MAINTSLPTSGIPDQFIEVARAEMAPVPTPEDDISEAEIAAEAYSLFEARGHEHGHDVEDWLAAEAIIRGRKRGFVNVG